MSVTIYITQNGRTESVDTDAGVNLLDVLGRSHFHVSAPCGGNGKCGKCRVQAEGELSPVTGQEKKLLSAEELDSGVRLACLTTALGDVHIWLEDSAHMSIQLEGMNTSLSGEHVVRAALMELEKPTVKNPIPASEALKKALDIYGVAEIPTALLNTAVRTRDKLLGAVVYGDKLVGLTAEAIPPVYGIAVDVGTTTLAMYLCELTAGVVVDVAAAENPQRAFGGDVISRMGYIIDNPEGLERQKGLITEAINSMISALTAKNGIAPDDVYSAVIVGNTVMQHIAAGLNPSGIANAPFAAADLFGRDMSAKELGININREGYVYLPPCFASYVGGDIATGLIASDTDTSPLTRVYIDIGTNGEIALSKDGQLTLCATAAGPAFEGAHIKQGLPGVPGAVNRVSIVENELTYEVIGGLKPSGICGSGIIDALAVMLDIGIVDEYGRIVDADELDDKYSSFAESLGEVDGESVFYIDKKADVYLTQKDIREIQLAKAAVCAGIHTLLRRSDTKVEQIDQLVLAGGFGSHIDKRSACRIGLIPPELEGKILVAGNTAGTGAAACLISKDARTRLEQLSGRSQYLELSGDALFMEEYVERMMF
ncbi:MAG: ASKHA domain-containing protein [Eubacteriales bacterium]